MAWSRVASLLLGGVLIGILGANEAAAEAASCRALLAKRDAECQTMAEKMQAVCTPAQGATDTPSAECRKLGQQLADHCNRNPCRAAPRKSKSKKTRSKRSKAKTTSMGKPSGSMGKSKSSKPKGERTKKK
ncbi:MAG: hypothetical protein ACRECO_21025 [Xanthobacteraceae bacterium]